MDRWMDVSASALMNEQMGGEGGWDKGLTELDRD